MTDYQYNIMQALLAAIQYDLATLSGDTLSSSSGKTWQEVSESLSKNMRKYADLLDEVQHSAGQITFPDFSDSLGDLI